MGPTRREPPSARNDLPHEDPASVVTPPGSALSGMSFGDAQALWSRLDLPPESGPDYRPLRLEISSVTDRVRTRAL
jgi:hypothetical protein